MIPILNAATVEALSGSDDASDRRLIRKSDSPAIVVKNILKIASALSTFGKVLGQAGLAPWLAILSSAASIGLLAAGTFRIFTPIAKEIQRLKSLRDDSL